MVLKDCQILNPIVNEVRIYSTNTFMASLFKEVREKTLERDHSSFVLILVWSSLVLGSAAPKVPRWFVPKCQHNKLHREVGFLCLNWIVIYHYTLNQRVHCLLLCFSHWSIVQYRTPGASHDEVRCAKLPLVQMHAIRTSKWQRLH